MKRTGVPSSTANDQKTCTSLIVMKIAVFNYYTFEAWEDVSIGNRHTPRHGYTLTL